MTAPRKHISKRATARKKYSVAKKVRQHTRKLKKEIRVMKNSGVQKPAAKVHGIPNAFPDKKKMLDEMEYQDKMQSEARKAHIALKKAQKAMPNGIMESYAEPIEAKVIVAEEKGKLTEAEIKEAERLMEITGEIQPNAAKQQGMGRRAFYKELQKVMEVSDVILQVLDARDPESCRSEEIEDQC